MKKKALTILITAVLAFSGILSPACLAAAAEEGSTQEEAAEEEEMSLLEQGTQIGEDLYEKVDEAIDGVDKRSLRRSIREALEEMDELVQSIKERGILSPLIVLPKPDDAHVFELISGHRRLFAAKKAGLKKVPAVVCNVSRDEASIMVVDSNLHREHILPSEKAKAYKLRLDAMKHQGKRTDLTFSPLDKKLNSSKELSELVGESQAQIFRFVRLNQLEPGLLSLVDESKIALRPAVELSYLTEDEQKNLLETIESEDCTPSLAQAQQMRKLSAQGKLDMDAIFEMMTKPKANQKEMVRLPMESISRFLPKNATPKDAAQFIEKACEHYRRYLNRQRDRDER